MGIPVSAFNRAIDMAHTLEAQGFFQRVRQGDQKAASLFARLVAQRLNPAGIPSDFGWLSKSPGESQVEGYAEDAIVYGNDEAERENVIDLVNGAGAPGASIGGGVKPRRENNRWVRPVPLSDDAMLYLMEGGAAQPLPPPSHTPTILSYEALGGDEGAKKITRVLEHDYKKAGRAGLDGDCGGWLRRTDYDVLSGISKTVEESILKHRDEWLMPLGLIEVLPPGMMSDGYRCRICDATVGFERGKPKLIPHATDCTTR